MMNDNSSMIAVLFSHSCSENCKPFEPSEWTRFADLLIAHKLQLKDIPDLSDNDMKQCFGYSEAEVKRIKKLLDRGGSLSFELEKYSARGIKVVTRADKRYPRALKKDYCPVLCRDHRKYPGNSGLIRLGAVPIDDSWDGNVGNFSSMKPDEGEQLTFLDQD